MCIRDRLELREYATGGNQLIVGEAFAVEAAARKVAKDFPKVSFLMGSSGKPAAPNFSVFDNYIQEPAYLSGMVAGSMTKSNKIGMVGGFPIPEVNRLMNAFMAGAKETNPKVEFSVSFINSWFDPPKAKEAAFAMIDKGADVMYAERFGVSDAAKEKGKLAIGNVINTQTQYPDTVVASALWHFEPSADRAIKLALAGKFVAEDYGPYSMMKHKGSTLAPLGTFEKKVPADIIANRLDPWHGAWLHPYAFSDLTVDEAASSVDRLVLDVSFRLSRWLAVPVRAEFVCPDARTICMTILSGEGAGSVVETHATPVTAPGAHPARTVMTEATIAVSDRPGFAVARRVSRVVAAGIRHTAGMLWVDDLAYAARTYELRRRGWSAKGKAD